MVGNQFEKLNYTVVGTIYGKKCRKQWNVKNGDAPKKTSKLILTLFKNMLIEDS